jgi:hypothetical protein
MDSLKITYTVSEGVPGLDGDAHNPWARAHRGLLETGQPIKKLVACYVDPLPIAVGLRWFGTFVFSAGERLIYFPGLTERQGTTLTSKRQSATAHQFEVDHISLEANRQRWHVTESGTKKHLGSYRTTDLGAGRALWFGMSIASADVLRAVKVSTEADSQVPSADALRRAEVAVRAREGLDFNILLFDQDQSPLFAGFCHFSLIVGPCGFESYRGPKLGLPFASPFIEPPLGNLMNLFLRSHRLSLAPHVEVEIVTTILPGRVTVPLALTLG